MSVTKKDIESISTRIDRVTQIGSKQLFIAHTTYSDISLIYSYLTIIGYQQFDAVYYTDRYYSSTTTRHKTELYKIYKAIEIKESELETFLDRIIL